MGKTVKLFFISHFYPQFGHLPITTSQPASPCTTTKEDEGLHVLSQRHVKPPSKGQHNAIWGKYSVLLSIHGEVDSCQILVWSSFNLGSNAPESSELGETGSFLSYASRLTKTKPGCWSLCMGLTMTPQYRT